MEEVKRKVSSSHAHLFDTPNFHRAKLVRMGNGHHVTTLGFGRFQLHLLYLSRVAIISSFASQVHEAVSGRPYWVRYQVERDKGNPSRSRVRLKAINQSRWLRQSRWNWAVTIRMGSSEARVGAEIEERSRLAADS